VVGGQVGDGGGVAPRESGGEAGQQDDEHGDEGDDGPHQREPPLGMAEISDGDEHAGGFLSTVSGSCTPARGLQRSDDRRAAVAAPQATFLDPHARGIGREYGSARSRDAVAVQPFDGCATSRRRHRLSSDMIHGARSQPHHDAATRRWEPTPVPALLRAGLHLLVGALLVLVAGRSASDQAPGWPWVVACAALVGVVYAV